MRARRRGAIKNEKAMTGRRLTELWTMPFAFLGFALWRVWVSLSYAAPALPMPVGAPVEGKLVYDACLAAASVALAFGARRLVPLAGRRWPYFVCLALMTGSSVLQVAVVNGWLGSALLVARDVCAGAGSAIMILLWCEIYACLSPTRVAVYLSFSWILGVLATFVLEGLRTSYLEGALIALPSLSLLLAWRSYGLYIEPADRPQATESRYLPLRLLGLVALYGLIEGLCALRVGEGYAWLVGSHSTWATLVGGALLFVCAYCLSDRLDFTRLYRTPAVLMVCGLLFIPLFGFGGSVLGAFCVSVSSTLFGCVVFLLLCDLSKRKGVAALWLFGLEEALVLMEHVGGGIESLVAGAGGAAFASYGDALVSVAGVTLIVAFTAVSLGGRGRATTPTMLSEQERLLAACELAAHAWGLTPREVEVLRLLVHGKSLSAVARELIIAEGTAKAHTQHIYEKAGVSRRQELLEAVREWEE